MENDIKQRIRIVEERMAEACRRSGRKPEDVRLVAVTKTKPVGLIRKGIEAGLTILGENYVQEAQEKIEEIGHAVQWHFIGRLQTKKSKYVVRLFDMVHSVDRLKLAVELDKRAAAAERRLPVLIEVNAAGEETKGGIDIENATRLVDQVMELPNLDLKGLMTMPPFFDQPEKARPYFAALRTLRDRIGPPLTELSMGMSGDFEVAIEEGATFVRVGSSIFGSRS